MSSKTKIIVLHMKEIIYTAIFAALGILLIVLLIFMFLPGRKEKPQPKQDSAAERQYTPGTYTSDLTLNDTVLDVEVSVDESHITSIRFSNLDEDILAMFPLIQPVMEDLAEQIYDSQSLDGIALSEETPYTSQVVLNAIAEAVEKAAAD